MNLRAVAAALSFTLPALGHAQKTNEWKINLAPFGFSDTKCAVLPERIDFLDDEHLVVSAPFACERISWGNPVSVKVTIIDLQGHVLATTNLDGVMGVGPGPIGYFSICANDQVELIGADLKTVASIPLQPYGRYSPCLTENEMISPSRTAMAIEDRELVPEAGVHHLFHGTSSVPVAEVITGRGESVEAAADDGFVVCSQRGDSRCKVIGPGGVAWSAPAPEAGYHVTGLLTPRDLLIMESDGNRLFAERPDGASTAVADIARIRPTFVYSNGMEMSANEPRRILYYANGCLVGYFEDCRGAKFHRLAVFDSASHQMLFHHSYAAEHSMLSPDGHVVAAVEGTELHLFQIP
jgi:hypothetical protein